MRIGELAERAGTSVKTIRYYDRIGVLRPEERSESGYRLYGEDALDRYRFVRAAQA
ncbi:MAG: MerR family DNA-binding transcriptional regulator, partial [Actinomycetota bacterium]|nr:MerR family DNA-binding transcriptional regulator [Actinomycetota bacterium]